jgi:nucleotide-binding universal stress UspA family protein
MPSMYERIVVALDGSERAERILPYVVALAQAFGSALRLLRATTPVSVIAGSAAGMDLAPPPTNVEAIAEAERQQATEYLRHLTDRLQGQNLQVVYEKPEGPPAEAILDHARRIKADVIALTTHGRGGAQRLVFGSVADAVLRAADCPVLLVRATD